MSDPKPMSRAGVEACLERAGLTLSKVQVDNLHQVSGYIARMVDRIGRDRPKSAEPALILTRAPK